MTEERLAAELGRLAGTMERMLHEAETQRAATEGLREELVRQRQEDNLRELRISGIEARLDEVEPVTRSVTSWKARMTGAGIVLGCLGSMAAGGVALFWDKLAQALGLK
ncbi:hypothetical protein SAMN05216376_105179 [Mameliella alba]|uniref:hypothetical protein n=1 Tax=Mameliella alba TaxID=561184 RepID=UPI00088E701D|nr:hypothetical protein [Mameliella alba]OWV48229.1 hypothetical protein CDZ96_10455 [Mameliella alba]PTR40270.1 hypothetical protein LX94_01752 [Mameliella alba]GGF43639.1 hypothetical protein GCM10011319_01790 [Mameliella alba]SDC97706.1 hypothetical protein SAMN05216376_105179 [Mameliella alba]